MNYLSILFFLAFLIYIWLISFVLYHNPRSILNWSCALVILCFAIWDLGDLLVNLYPTFNYPRLKISTYSSIGWCSFPSFALWFFLIFTKKKSILKHWVIYSILFVVPLFFIYKQYRGFLIIDFITTPNAWSYVWSKSIWKYLYYAYYNLFLFTGFYMCFDLIRKTEKLFEKRQAGIILITGIITLILGSITNVILPELKIYTIPPIGSSFVLIWATGLVYAVTRYGLMAVTPQAAAEDILATMADSLVLTGPNRNIIRVNKATLDLLGFREEELIGKSVDTILNERSLFKGEQFQRLIREGQIRDFEMDYKTKSGELIPVSFSASLMYNPQKEMMGIVGVARDLRQIKQLITALQEERAYLDIKVRQRTAELERLNQELKTTQAQLIQSAKMAAVGQLGAGVAHELNNPLGGILGYAQFILEKFKRPEFSVDDFKASSKYLESIEREASRCKGIVENLLKFSRRPISVKPEALDIASALNETLSIIGHQLKLKNINLILDIKEDLARVVGITNQLQQVFTNLILNAQQAISSGGELKITARNILDETTHAPTHVRIEFTDTGCGISEEHLKHLFEPFFTTKQKEKGTGLGLAVSYQIIQEHKGSIEVTSEVGRGTRVGITLPAIK